MKSDKCPDSYDELISVFEHYEAEKQALYCTRKGNKTFCFRCGDLIYKQDAIKLQWGYHGQEVDICDYCEGELDG